MIAIAKQRCEQQIEHASHSNNCSVSWCVRRRGHNRGLLPFRSCRAGRRKYIDRNTSTGVGFSPSDRAVDRTVVVGSDPTINIFFSYRAKLGNDGLIGSRRTIEVFGGASVGCPASARTILQRFGMPPVLSIVRRNNLHLQALWRRPASTLHALNAA